MSRVLMSVSLAGSFFAMIATASLLPVAATGATVSSKAGHKLVPHRAVYDMKLGESDDNAGIAGLSGRMVYEFSGNSCDGYSVNFRFVTRFQNTDGGSQVTDLQTTSFEEPQAESYQFLSKTYVDQELVEETRGTARVGSDAKTVELKEPSEKSLEIGREVLFPTEHLLSVLKAAEEGVSFLTADIYDGAETGEKVYSTTTVIGAKAASPIKADADSPEASLAGLSYWPVTVAYFDPGAEDATGELTPVYQLSFWLFQNGVSGRLNLDYGDFSIKGKMAALEVYDEGNCSQQ
ncbi:cell envelope integrity EipB family protein [Roseibium sp. MMSF_3544]|uniref:cell envelope integrity EipB family protein n=1 Tax=unclassified Roseibium TaxID=2629323 RepID=UPI00273D0426|nr:cell envelope integrity EipB family protein [Roseibium sp. MMSF_3544]